MKQSERDRLIKLEQIVVNIRDNHLHSIEEKINKLDGRMWLILTTAAVGAVGTLASMLFG
jgi:hypothetical protein